MPQFTTSDGAALSYLDQGEGRPVVLVAGYGAPASTWALQVDALLGAGYRAISFDRRSHGDSESTLFGQRMSRHGKDIGELLESLELTDVSLVGGSMGANAIWAYLDLTDSARVHSIISVDQTPKMVNTPDWPYGFYGVEYGNVGTFFDSGIPDTGRGRSIDQSMPGIMKLVERLGGMPKMGVANSPETVHLLRDHAFQDWRDVINRCEVPALMVAGRQSQYWDSGHAQAAVAGSKAGSAVILDDCGHAANLDQPEAFNRVMLQFLGGTS